MPKVFISYSHNDEGWKKRLQKQLAVLERQGLLSVWEDRQIAGGDDWYPTIEQAINEAHVAVLLISADFLSSKFILGEEVPRLLERRKNEGLRVIPLILKPCAWEAVSWLGKIQGRPLENKPLSGFSDHDQDHHLCELVREINQLLESVPVDSALPEKTSPQPLITAANYDPRNPAFLVPFRQKGKYMVGREQALQKVRQQLLEGKPTSIGQTALFQGMGGLGKTQLAVEYAYQYQEAYPNGVYWITADGNIDAQLTKIAVDARWVAPESEHATKLDIARHRIRSYSDCLIVFDNLETVDAIRDYLPEPQANPHILVTSRREQPEFADIKLDLLDDGQSCAMLVQEADRPPEKEEEKTAACEIASALGGLPLALELAGAYLAHRPISWCAYRDLLRENLKQALPKQLSSLTKHDADLFKTLSISEREIGEEPLLAEVLDLLTWSGASTMGLSLMAHLLNVKPVELNNALGLGVALRLLQQEKGGERYAIHRLVQEVRRQDRPLDQRGDWIKTIAQHMGAWFEERRDEFNELPAYEQELDHLRAWQHHTQQSIPLASIRLLWLQAYPAYHRGRNSDALQIVQQATALYESQDRADTVLQANLLNDLAYCQGSMGDFTEALKLAQQALDKRRELFVGKHPDIATSLDNLASHYSELGNNPQRALELAQQALDMRRELFGGKHPDIALSLSNLASCYSELGNPQRALEFTQQALDMRRELVGDKHPGIANSLNNLASYYSDLGNPQRALELAQQALDMRRELFGDKHPDIAQSLNNLASFYSELGNHQRALELTQQALDMRRELFGDKHPDIATSLNNLAHDYAKLGNSQRAIGFAQQALEMRRELLGASHPDTIASLKFVARRLFANPLTAGRGKVLVEEYLRLITRDHPARQELLEFLGSRKGFRKPGHGGHGKKSRKRR